ncbi:hypothetical protein [Actinomadura rayongensis]|uniref:DUF11 domain-containing protein n=1 Tax=Actinomadura rayongensis TaxID=1429076 RepID=A0A6I4VWU3_9ACTN|nr:hypothetical protein [Actinomadura rayongensis]MXQ62809.1 hypothetical protein [Actinomadura rayongensis]
MTIKHMRGPATIALASALMGTLVTGAAHAAPRGDDPATASAPEAKLAVPQNIGVRKYVDKDLVTVGERLHYRIHVHNRSRFITHAEVTDELDSIREHGRILSIGATTGHVTLGRTKFVWHGILQPYRDADITFTVRTGKVGWIFNTVRWGGKNPGRSTVKTRIVPKHTK